MKTRRLNEEAKRFYIDEIVSAPGGKTETERHSFATLDELKKYCKDANLTKDDIANCGGCDVKDLCESYADVKIPRAVKEFVDNLCNEINADQGEPDDYEDEDEDEDPWSTEYGYNENLWDRGTGGDYNMYGRPSSYYADEVMEAVIEEFGDVLKTDEQKLAVYCYVEFMDEPEWVDTLSEDIDKFKRNEYSECLNEAYFDTAEYRIQKYEDDIPELMAGMHDDYMEGKLDAASYAEVLKKVYDALSECDYKHTMSAPVVKSSPSKRILDRLAELDKTNEALGVGAGLALGGAAIGAGMVGSALLDSVQDDSDEEVLTEKETMNETTHQYTLEYVGKNGDTVARDYFNNLNKAKQFALHLKTVYEDECRSDIRGLCITDEHDVEVWSVEIEVCDPEYDDDFEDMSMFEDFSSLKTTNLLYTGSTQMEEEFDDDLCEDSKWDSIGTALETELKKRHLKLNPEKITVEAAAEYIQMAGDDYSVEEWIADTLQNYPDHIIKENLDEGFNRRIDITSVAIDVANLLDVDRLGEENWIEFDRSDARPTMSGEETINFEAIGATRSIRGHMTTKGDQVDIRLQNGSEAICNSAEEIARFVAGEFGIAL